MADLNLKGKTVLITGAARRIGRALALASAGAGADVVIHYCQSKAEAEETKRDVEALGNRAWTLQADLSKEDQTARLVDRAFELSPLFALVNNAALFGDAILASTSLEDWQMHLAVNLTAPFVLTQAFCRLLGGDRDGRVVNMLDWRALRPGSDHFAYTVTKSALAAMT